MLERTFHEKKLNKDQPERDLQKESSKKNFQERTILQKDRQGPSRIRPSVKIFHSCWFIPYITESGVLCKAQGEKDQRFKLCLQDKGENVCVRRLPSLSCASTREGRKGVWSERWWCCHLVNVTGIIPWKRPRRMQTPSDAVCGGSETFYVSFWDAINQFSRFLNFRTFMNLKGRAGVGIRQNSFNLRRTKRINSLDLWNFRLCRLKNIENFSIT